MSENRQGVLEMGKITMIPAGKEIRLSQEIYYYIRPLTLGSFDICMKLCLAIIQPFFKIYRSHFATVLTVAAVSAALLTEQRRIKSGRDFLQALIR